MYSRDFPNGCKNQQNNKTTTKNQVFHKSNIIQFCSVVFFFFLALFSHLVGVDHPGSQPPLDSITHIIYAHTSSPQITLNPFQPLIQFRSIVIRKIKGRRKNIAGYRQMK